MQTPSTLSLYKAYNSGQDLIGVVQVDFPTIQLMTTEMKGADVGGVIDMPVVGMPQSMVTTMNFRTVTKGAFALLQAATSHLEFWGSIQTTEHGSGRLIAVQHKVITRGLFKNLTPGKMAVGETQDRSIELETTYFKEMLAGIEHLEIDKLNTIFRVDGVDQLAAVRANIGM